MSDDDWFERALRGSGDSQDRTDADDDRDGDDDDGGKNVRNRVASREDLIGSPTEAEGTDHNDVIDEDFVTAFERAPGPDRLGDDDGGGTPADFIETPTGLDTFTDEGVDSNIPRIKVGIGGLDEMIQGGVPKRSLIATIGKAGTGKTTFGLQFLNEALSNDERAIFITLEQSYDEILATAVEMGWAFDEYVERGDLAMVDIDPIEMVNSLASIQDELPRLISEFGATRLVLDSVSLLEMMYEDRASRRSEIYDFTQSLKESGVTTMLTSEAGVDSPYASRYGIVEYLTDAVFVLSFIRQSDFPETRLGVEIQKIRNANHSRETKPYEITNEGIRVYGHANIF